MRLTICKISKGAYTHVDPSLIYGLLETLLPRALRLSQFVGDALIEYDNSIMEESTLFNWKFRGFSFLPVITFTPSTMSESGNVLGTSLTHEFIHCRQGFWRIVKENLLSKTFKKEWNDMPPFEQEAYNAANLWYDDVYPRKKKI